METCNNCLYWAELDNNKGMCQSIDSDESQDVYLSVDIDNCYKLEAALITSCDFGCANHKLGNNQLGTTHNI